MAISKALVVFVVICFTDDFAVNLINFEVKSGMKNVILNLCKKYIPMMEKLQLSLNSINFATSTALVVLVEIYFRDDFAVNSIKFKEGKIKILD